MANKIQIRRGLKTNLPSLDVGEPALCTDTREVYVGNSGGNVQLVSKETLDSHTGNYTLQIPYAAAAGSANSYTVTLSPAMKGYTEGVSVAVKINATNTGASTINICGLGAKSIVDSKGNALAAGKLVANSIYTLRYNGTNFILQGEGGEYGNVTQADVRSGVTFGTENGLLTGTSTSRRWKSGTTAQAAGNNTFFTSALGFAPSVFIWRCGTTGICGVWVDPNFPGGTFYELGSKDDGSSIATTTVKVTVAGTYSITVENSQMGYYSSQTIYWMAIE
jgi:hypothetical protein